MVRDASLRDAPHHEARRGLRRLERSAWRALGKHSPVKDRHMATNRVYRVAVIPGDGIGKEVVPEGVRVLEAAAKKFGFELRLDHFDFASCDYYEKHERMMPEDWKEQ